MPENYYCLDNFFQKMTDLESPRKNNDCYFYYYSTCTKGDNCTFRHEPSALGCETTCSFWKEGKCINVRCNFRHMELRKNRKTIPCYWESQPSGCKKPHCPFMHVTKKNIDGDDNENLSDGQDEICNIKSKKDDFAAPVVDPIVVNFEEESDNESSTPTQSSHHKSTHQSHAHSRQAHHEQHTADDQQDVVPLKAHSIRGGAKAVEVKTLEEIKLDRIQAESAAYYSYSDELTPQVEEKDSTNGRKSIFKRLQPLGALGGHEKSKEVNIQDVQVLTLDEIRRRKRKNQTEEVPTEIPLEISTKIKKQRVNDEPSELNIPAPSKRVTLKRTKPVATNVDEIKIKTLAEIKAEKQLKRKLDDSDLNSNQQSEETKEEANDNVTKRVRITISKEPDEQEVSSTSKTDETQAQELSTETTAKVQCVVAPVKRHIEVEKSDLESTETKTDLPPPKPEVEDENVVSNITENLQSTSTNENDFDDDDVDMCKNEDGKLDDLLLDDDDDDAEGGSLTLKAEDDILNDIDDLLNE